jgi:hypothetical protein
VTAAALPDRLADLAGPIVVKEVRQGLRAKAFAVCFGLLLVACLVAALAAAADLAQARRPLGPSYLSLFFGAQSLVCLFVIPFTAFRSTARESEEETWVLLALTGMTGRQIVLGKASSSFVQAILYASCCAPFVLFSYYLNGVDLVTLAIGLAINFAACALLVCGAVALGTEGATPFGRTATLLIALALIGGSTFLAVIGQIGLAKEGGRLVRDPGFIVAVGALVFLLLSSAWVLIEAAGANLALATESNTATVRKVIVAQHVGAQMIAYALALIWKRPDPEAVAALSLVASFVLAVESFFLVSERDGRIVARPNGWTAPGAMRGFGLLMGLLLFDTVGWIGLYAFTTGRDRVLSMLFAAPAYVGLYACAAVVLGRKTPLSRLGAKVGTRIGFAVSVVAATVLLPVAALACGESYTDPFFNALSPLIGPFSFLESGRDVGARLIVLWLAFVVAVPIAYATLLERDEGQAA